MFLDVSRHIKMYLASKENYISGIRHFDVRKNALSQIRYNNLYIMYPDRKSYIVTLWGCFQTVNAMHFTNLPQISIQQQHSTDGIF